MIRSLVAVGVVAVAAFTASQAFGAGAVSGPARLSSGVVAPGHPVTARINLHERMTSVDNVCLTFTFVNDLLDPGETVVITPLQLFPSLGGFGFENPGPSAQAQRTICITTADQPDIAALFADGKDNRLQIGMTSGSVEIASLVITVTGT